MRQLFIRLFSTIILSFFFSTAYADINILNKADSLFTDGKYTESMDLYRSIYNEGMYTPAMLLKMAYVEEGLKNYPAALLYLATYDSHSPDPDVLAKMSKLAEQRNLLGYEYNESAYLRNLYRQYHGEIVMMLEVLFLLTFLFTAYTVYNGREAGAARVTLLLILGVALALSANEVGQTEHGVLIGGDGYLMSGPSAGAPVLEIVSPGHRLEIMEREGPWVQVLWNGQEAFVREHLVAEVR